VFCHPAEHAHHHEGRRVWCVCAVAAESVRHEPAERDAQREHKDRLCTHWFREGYAGLPPHTTARGAASLPSQLVLQVFPHLGAANQWAADRWDGRLPRGRVGASSLGSIDLGSSRAARRTHMTLEYSYRPIERRKRRRQPEKRGRRTRHV